MKALLAALLLSALSVRAQDRPASPHKPAKAIQKSLPVSKYLRKVGVLYVQTLEDVSRHCDGLVSDAAAQRECSASMESSGPTLDEIESMVAIELSDSRFSGD